MTSLTKASGKGGSVTSINTKQSSTKRLHGRITKEDIRSAGLRRWNGRSRITTDWINLYHEPELCFSSGDLLVYLRQPGQSSRGPAFHVHTSVLRERGFEVLLDQCVTRPSLHAPKQCLLRSCPGCDSHSSTAELYIPAPLTANIDTVFDHHITTRNFFAWLYDLPLAGRALGASSVALKERVDQYSSSSRSSIQNKREIIAYAESQKYLDFRECADHALAALVLAEQLQQEDMWIDAFAHAVGMSHRDISSSFEYEALGVSTQALILDARYEMDVRLVRASMSIETFFGDDLSGNFLGLSNAAKDHFDRFRSFLHGIYIEHYGFWPPAGFDSESSRFSIYATLYSDFRNLYHHLVDPNSTTEAAENFSSGGVCTLQNIEAFDSRHGFDTLPHPLPLLPQESLTNSKIQTLQRRRSWNPMIQKRSGKEARNKARAQALVDASNRDMTYMSCPLVRRYSDFEALSVADELEHVSWIDGRKVRWILVYAILQTLISIMAAPKHVRNTSGLTYSLCCHVPINMPWASSANSLAAKTAQIRKEIAPDIDYRHKNSSASTLEIRPSRTTDRKSRRLTMPAQVPSTSRSTSMPRVASLKRLLSRRRPSTADDEPPVPRPPTRGHCEILIHGYGNGLNEVEVAGLKTMTLPSAEQLSRRNSLVPNVVPQGEIFQKFDTERMPHDGDEDVPDLSPTGSGSVSRETSNASTASAKSKSTCDTDVDIVTPVDIKDMTLLVDVLNKSTLDSIDHKKFTYDEIDGLPGSIHINTTTWDQILA